MNLKNTGKIISKYAKLQILLKKIKIKMRKFLVKIQRLNLTIDEV